MKSVSQIRNYDWSISSISGWGKKKYHKKTAKSLKNVFLGLGLTTHSQYEARDSFILNVLVSIFKYKLYKISITLKKHNLQKNDAGSFWNLSIIPNQYGHTFCVFS